MTTTNVSPADPALAELVEATLRGYASGAWEESTTTSSSSANDPGPAVLAALACELGWASSDVIDRALERWLETLRVSGHLGLFGGLAGITLGAHVVSPHRPRFGALSARLQRAMERGATASLRRSEVSSWGDYDLISGAAGVVLASRLVAAHGDDALTAHAAAYLASLCEDDDLGHLRIASYQGDELRGWNHGRINTGLAHGVGGVVAGLCHGLRAGHTKQLVAPLRRACHWLAEESYVDPRGLHTWCPAAMEGAAPPAHASRRQAWCYGTPGLSWVLWESGRALEDGLLVELAESAMRSYCAAFDERVYLGHDPAEQTLAVCHGAAGILAVADAFAIHAGLPEAAALAESLTRFVHQRFDRVAMMARQDMRLLSGASGTLAVLSTRAGGSRSWLSALALR